MTLRESIESIRTRGALPERDRYEDLLDKATFFLEQESPGLRPSDSTGVSGGLVRLKRDIPTLILPDLHGRKDFFAEAMTAPLFGGDCAIDSMKSGAAQVLCLGDAFHTEYGTRSRWQDAFAEYQGGFKKRGSMDAEMEACLALMEMILACKTAYPDNFHFLKGNHENILNEEGHGNHAFMKIAFEGDMVRSWTEKVFGLSFLERFARVERAFPLLAQGSGFLASHAEPRRAFVETEIIEARSDPEVTLGLTWTANGEAEDGSVQTMLEAFLPDSSGAVYLAGHRPITERYAFRANGRFIQIHNPAKKIFALAAPGKAFDPETDVRELP